uniref:Uncharacterized protein n=1 Tax=Marseillevirus LCMAC101 TaxID=2506602 RepID=A0A481YSQ5_9VIRU|nr:MAG: hypothetical protein LCMAC101_06940 [Marseillevirus LCMAC101]
MVARVFHTINGYIVRVEANTYDGPRALEAILAEVGHQVWEFREAVPGDAKHLNDGGCHGEKLALADDLGGSTFAWKVITRRCLCILPPLLAETLGVRWVDTNSESCGLWKGLENAKNGGINIEHTCWNDDNFGPDGDHELPE